MSIRLPHETVEQTTKVLPAGALDLDWLAELVREASQPLPIGDLAREAVRASLIGDEQLRLYVPGRHYRRGERLRLLDGRLGDVVTVEGGENPNQGAFKVIWLRLRDGEMLRLASEVADGPTVADPQLIRDDIVDQLLGGQESDMVRRVRQALASDPRFITLYYSDGEYAALREFFPPMSPDVLDAALALLLDALFDQVPISRITAAPAAPSPRPLAAITTETLFSTDHVDGVVALNPEWDEAARSAFETVRALWRRAVEQGAAWDDQQMARNFAHPLLRALGWSIVPLPQRDGEYDGLYALCANEVAASGLYTDYELGGAVSPWVTALNRTAAWQQSLDRPAAEGFQPGKATQHDAVRPVVAGHQLVADLRRTEVRWGVLTNGRVWRLLSRDANSLSRVFYEIDLASVFDGLDAHELPNPERWKAFRRWYVLFRQASYTLGGDGTCLLERLRGRLPQGERKARDLLSERLVAVVLPAVAGGFLTYRRERNGILDETAATLRTVYRASFDMVLRMLFVLIAEARGLLPLSNPDYRPHSLTGQARWAVERLHRELPISSNIYTTPRYDLVLALLHRVSRGDAEKGIPCYGRLFFDPSEQHEHAFLEQARLSDQAIAVALDGLTRGVDYSNLDARDLIAACAEMVGVRLEIQSVRDEGVHVVVTPDEPARSWSILPDYVVTSSVEQAVAPILAKRGVRFDAAMDIVANLRRRLRKTLDRQKRAVLYAEWESAVRIARDAFLGLRICDPAMGGGEFLLSAVDVLTDGIVERLQGYHVAHPDIPREWNPIYLLIDKVREDVRNELARYDASFDERQLDDATILARLVAQRCLFGVADDPMAAQLAKVGLWLHTFTQGAPLSFLDHHLRWGNALLGADIDNLGDVFETSTFLDSFSAAVSALYPLTERIDTTPLDVRWSEGQHHKVQETLAPHRLLLNLVTSAALGDTEADAALAALRSDLLPYSGLDLARVEDVAPTWLQAQAEAEGFFHWPLEFPELFLDLANGSWLEAPAVDLVLGSPPYVTVSDSLANDVVRQFYVSRFGGDSETIQSASHAFLSLARQLVSGSGGRTAYVLSRKWLASPVGGI